MFRKNAHLTDPAEVESKLALAEFVKKGTYYVIEHNLRRN